jgi:hypothetical protein
MPSINFNTNNYSADYFANSSNNNTKQQSLDAKHLSPNNDCEPKPQTSNCAPHYDLDKLGHSRIPDNVCTGNYDNPAHQAPSNNWDKSPSHAWDKSPSSCDYGQMMKMKLQQQCQTPKANNCDTPSKLEKCWSKPEDGQKQIENKLKEAADKLTTAVDKLTKFVNKENKLLNKIEKVLGKVDKLLEKLKGTAPTDGSKPATGTTPTPAPKQSSPLEGILGQLKEILSSLQELIEELKGNSKDGGAAKPKDTGKTNPTETPATGNDADKGIEDDIKKILGDVFGLLQKLVSSIDPKTLLANATNAQLKA